jgi:S1-C subfamily serine protease
VDYASIKLVTRSPLPRELGGDTVNCVLLTEVEQNSPAWKEGLRQDMYITHVGKTRVTTPKEFHAAVAGKSGPIKLRVLSGSGDGRPTIKEIPSGDE